MFSPFLKKKNANERETDQDLDVQAVSEESQEEPAILPGKPETGEEPLSSLFANKAQMDKKSLDLVFAVEQMIQAKQHVEISYRELQDRLSQANGHIERMGKDLKNLNKVIEERERSILELEQKLTERNLKVDQMMEDYRELQSSLSGEIEELKGVIEIERQKYASLLQKHNEMHAEKNKRISDLEEKIGKQEIEYSHLKQKFEALRQEKTYLLNMVNDFTARLTTPFASNTSGRDDGSSD